MCVTHASTTTPITDVVSRRRGSTTWSGVWMAFAGITATLGAILIGVSFKSPTEEDMNPEDVRPAGIGMHLGGLAVLVPLAIYTSGEDTSETPAAPEIETNVLPATACEEPTPDTGRRVDILLRVNGLLAQRRSVTIDERGSARVDFSGAGSVEAACRGLGIAIRPVGGEEAAEKLVDHEWFEARRIPSSVAQRFSLQDLARGCCAATRQATYSQVCRARCLEDTRTTACFDADKACRVSARKQDERGTALGICRELFDECLETRETNRLAVDNCISICEIKMARYECQSEEAKK